MWVINVWDGNSSWSFQRKGSYEAIVNSLAGYPPAYIWSIHAHV